MPNFDPTIPQPGDFISDSQAALLNNNQALDQAFAVNHFAFSDTTASKGKHTYVEMVNQAAKPAPLAGGEGTIYTKLASGVSNLFYVHGNVADEYQLTNVNHANFGSCGAANGWGFLQQGIIIQWGSVVNQNGGVPVVFPVAFSALPYSIQLTGTDGGAGALGTGTVTLTNFLFTGGAVRSFYYIAIGLKA